MTAIDIRRIRADLGLSQSEFCDRFHINLRTLQQWEQGRSEPDGPVRAYLKVIARAPGAVHRALNVRRKVG